MFENVENDAHFISTILACSMRYTQLLIVSLISIRASPCLCYIGGWAVFDDIYRWIYQWRNVGFCQPPRREAQMV